MDICQKGCWEPGVQSVLSTLVSIGSAQQWKKEVVHMSISMTSEVWGSARSCLLSRGSEERTAEWQAWSANTQIMSHVSLNSLPDMGQLGQSIGTPAGMGL